MAFCSNCGKELNTGAAFCSSCGAAVNGGVAGAAPVYTTTRGMSDNYSKIKAEYDRARGTKVLGVWAAILCFGIGIFFSIGVWTRCSNISIYNIKNVSPEERYMIEETDRQYELARKLARVPIAAIGICIIMTGILIAVSMY
ncbi:MAG: zinc-ribbon domain-containing protein [Clostridia bacterium]|nr:zinc-ribbon domain-containing protein [Clostridia bacterium]